MECGVCIENFDGTERVPKVLPCGHTACLQCLRRLPDSRCPTCRRDFNGPPDGLPSNFTVLQLLEGRRPDSTPRCWCSDCRTAPSPRCWEDHDVLSVRSALRRQLQGALPQVAQQLQGLQDQCRDEQALPALTLLTGESWDVSLRGGGRELTGTLRNTEEPLTKVLWLLLAARAALTEDRADARDPPLAAAPFAEGPTRGPPPAAAPFAEGPTRGPPPAAAPFAEGPTRGPPPAAAPFAEGPTRGPPPAAAPFAEGPTRGPPPAAAPFAEGPTRGPPPAAAPFAERPTRGPPRGRGPPPAAAPPTAAPTRGQPLAEARRARRARPARVLDVRHIISTPLNPSMRRAKETTLKTVPGVTRLVGVHCVLDPDWSLELLKRAAPSVEQLSVFSPGQPHLLALRTMPRLRRLLLRDHHNAQLCVLPALPPGHDGLRWLSVCHLSLATTQSLLRSHAHSLKELQLHVGTAGVAASTMWPIQCRDLHSLLHPCGLRALRRLVLKRSDSHHTTAQCYEQRVQVHRVLPRAEVLCEVCDDVEVEEDV